MRILCNTKCLWGELTLFFIVALSCKHYGCYNHFCAFTYYSHHVKRSIIQQNKTERQRKQRVHASRHLTELVSFKVSATYKMESLFFLSHNYKEIAYFFVYNWLLWTSAKKNLCELLKVLASYFIRYYIYSEQNIMWSVALKHLLL